MAADLGAVVDAVVSADLSALSVSELQTGSASLASQVKRLTGFGGAMLAELQSRSRIETILCDARITRVLLDSARQVQGLEPLGDDVTRAQRRALAARDRGCTARGCTRPPAFCDAHHLVARADGVPSTLGNLVLLLCRRHHVLCHLGKISLHDLQVPWITSAAGPAPPIPPLSPPGLDGSGGSGLRDRCARLTE